MKDCGRYERWTALASGGDLPPRRWRKLEEHRAGCERCRELAAGLTATRADLRALADEPADLAALAAVRSRVMARIAVDRPARHARLWWWVLAPAAAALAIALIVMADRGGRPERPPQAASLPHKAFTAEPPMVVARRQPARTSRPLRTAPRPVIPKDPDAPPLLRYETSDPHVVVYWVTESAED